MQATVSGEAEEDVVAANLRTGQVFPLFVLSECSLCVVLWVLSAGLEHTLNRAVVVAGLDSLWRGGTDLRFWGPRCEDHRFHAWRWLTYQFTHASLAHVMTNAFDCLMLGIPLEGMHGHLRMLVMFNAGVAGGALCAMVADTHSSIIGCSGGIFSLIGIHFADLLMNWRERKFRVPTLLLLIGLVLMIVFLGLQSPAGRVSHSAHVGGGITGLLVGVAAGRNLKVRAHQTWLLRAAWPLGIALLVFCLAWHFAQAESPRSIWEVAAGERGWCWCAKMLNVSVSPLAYRCIRCGTPECVAVWEAFNATETQKHALPSPAVVAASFASCQRDGWYGER